jgi:hypothetical protein
MMIGGGLIGSLVALWLGSPRQRRLALGTALAEVGFLAIGISNYWLAYWFGPSIWYFELYLFPYFALCICFLLLIPFTIAWRIAVHLLSLAGERRVGTYVNVALAVTLPLVVATKAWTDGPAVQAESEKNDTFWLASPYPQPDSEITRVLKDEIKLVPGQKFRGRVAVMVGRIFPQEREWERYSLVHYFAQIATGNLHDGPGLWQDDVPTLGEYNTLMTPAYFAFLRRLLSDPHDIQIRNYMGVRHIDPRILKAVGVRFLITDRPISGATLRVRLPIPVSHKTRLGLGFGNLDLDGFDLYLYEFDGVNFGQFSPTETKVAADANQTLTYLSDGAMAPDRIVIVGDSMPGPFTAATLELFTVERDHYRLRATSAGRSILLLPFEFSHCLKITDARGGMPRLFRADLLLTGVVFERQLDARISFYTGPFHNSRCRLDDLADSNRMAMRNAFQDHPAFGVLRPR